MLDKRRNIMGFREELISNWEDKTIEYGGKKFYIIKQLNHEGTEYLYGIDIETYDKDPMNVVFLYKIKDDIFEHVEDEELFEKLLIQAGGLCAADLVGKAIEEHKDELFDDNNDYNDNN